MESQFEVFISYSRANRRFADRLARDLRDHHVSVWLDRLELLPGDQPRRRIDDAIAQSRYFCLLVSEASMRSYYVRRLELEAAFTRMIREHREAFVIPVLIQRPAEELPLMLASLQYVDCSRPEKYLKGLQQIVKRIRLESERYTGSRWFKNVDTSIRGTMVGVGEITRAPHHGACVKAHFHDGLIRAIDLFTDAGHDGAKSITYDANDRVLEIVLIRKDRIVDTWRYEYHAEHGYRTRKYIYKPGTAPHILVEYDADGNKVRESYLRPDGSPDDSRGYAVLEWRYDSNGVLSEEVARRVDGTIVPAA